MYKYNKTILSKIIKLFVTQDQLLIYLNYYYCITLYRTILIMSKQICLIQQN